MARRKRLPKNALSNDPLLMAIAVLVVLIIVAPIVWKVVMSFILIFGVAVYLYIYKRQLDRIRATGIFDIDEMDGVAFEKRLWLLFQSLGYKVETTPTRGDWGADLILTKDNLRTVVQAKRYSKPVGLSAVQEAVTARAKYNCAKALVVTNNTFTAQARELAFHNSTELWDRDRLIQELGRVVAAK